MAYKIGTPTAEQFIDDNGDPAVNHVLYFYVEGTTTPTSIAFDNGGVSTATSVTIGADGFPANGGSPVAVYYDDTVTYDIVRKDSGGTAYGPTIESYSVSPAAGFSRRVVTASETYTPAANVTAIEFELVGGGGGSGGAAATAGNSAIAGGGGGGGYVKHTTTTIAASYTVTIGAGGTGGAAGDNDGTAGGDTIITDGASFTLTASGGGLGEGSPAGGPNGAGGAGGAATGGTINVAGTGADGSLSHAVNPVGDANGGDSYVQRGSNPSINAAGVAGLDYGAGACGAYNGNSQSARAGAAGGAGVLILTEYL